MLGALTFTDRVGTHGHERVYRCTSCRSSRAYWIGEEPTAQRIALVASFAAYAWRVHVCADWNRWFSPLHTVTYVSR